VHGRFRAHLFQSLASGEPVVAVTLGDIGARAPLLARVHSSCVTSEAYGACDCDCAEQLDDALQQIAQAGRGVVFYLMQEGRGAGFTAKARDRMLVQASGHTLTTFEAYARMGLERDQRRYDAVPVAARLLGITAPFTLLTSNPEKAGALEDAGVALAGTRALAFAPTPFNRHYLAAKAGTPAGGELADLPEPVADFAPYARAGASHLVHVASYLLPLRFASSLWFRVHVYFDAAARLERVLLTYGKRRRGRPALVRVQRDTLRERFPLRAPRLRRQWRAAVARIAAHGAGCAVFLGARAWEASTAGDVEWATLLATHLPGDGARILLDGAADPDRNLARRMLARAAIPTGRPASL
jgi:GTP cyclohydrolase II